MTPDELEILKLQVEAWKKVIEVQEHFNDIEMRIRTLLLTLVGVLLGVAAGFGEHSAATLAPVAAIVSTATSPTMTAVLIICSIFAILFGYMDAFWYHIYLRGAVNAGIELEKTISQTVPGINLSTMVNEESHKEQLFLRRSTGDRLLLFYGAIAYLSAAAAVVTRTQDGEVLGVLAITGAVSLLLWIFCAQSAAVR